MDIKEIINRNYQATVKRGLITYETCFDEFINKIHEELVELNISNTYYGFDKSELADIILVCFAMSKHFRIDILKELENKVIINENRKD